MLDNLNLLFAAVSPNILSALALNGTFETTISPDFIDNLIVLGISFYVLMMALAVVMIVSLWKIYKKAGQPGWASIVPIYNIIKMLEIVKDPIVLFLLIFVPFVNQFFMIYLFFKLSKVFGKGNGFSILTALLPFIGLPILAFGDAKYVDDSGSFQENPQMSNDQMNQGSVDDQQKTQEGGGESNNLN